ncbi:hypothetical protein [Microcoleus sp. F4-D5]|uniref:hypothetical protein n=1 Tax=Microcoleus sp. F4-D5 TaxID=2818760 RepID=UPI002FD58FE3
MIPNRHCILQAKNVQRASGNPYLRRVWEVPGPPIKEIQAKLLCWLTPESLKPLRLNRRSQKLGDGLDPGKLGLLTLPVTIAVVLSLVYRRISRLSDMIRVLESEKLLWIEPFKVSKQALSKLLPCLPADLFAQVFEPVIAKVQSRADQLPIPISWESVYQNFSAIGIAEGSTLEAVRIKLKANGDSTTGFGGRIMILEGFHHPLVATRHPKNRTVHASMPLGYFM